jgi:hypothetical protein
MSISASAEFKAVAVTAFKPNPFSMARVKDDFMAKLFLACVLRIPVDVSRISG